MLVVLPYSLVAHTDAKAAEVMANYNKILEALNGNIDRENIKDGEILTAKLANAAATSAKHKPTMLEKKGSEAKALKTAEFIDVPGLKLEVNPAVTSNVVIDVMLAVFKGIEGGQACTARIYVDGVEAGSIDPTLGGGIIGHNTISGHAVVQVGAGAHTITVKAVGEGWSVTAEAEGRKSRLWAWMAAA